MVEDFLNCIKYSLSDTVVDRYDSLNEKSKNVLRMMETPTVIFKKLCGEIKTKFIVGKLDSKEKLESSKEKLIT